MKLLILSLCAFIAISTTTFAQPKIKLKIGAKLPKSYLPCEDCDQPRIAASQSQSWPYIEAKVAGVKYIIGFDDDSLRIRYLHTIDHAFRTSDGLSVGSKIRVTQEQLNIHHLWYTFAGTTRDGWRIIVGDSEESLSDMKVRGNSDSNDRRFFTREINLDT